MNDKELEISIEKIVLNLNSYLDDVSFSCMFMTSIS